MSAHNVNRRTFLMGMAGVPGAGVLLSNPLRTKQRAVAPSAAAARSGPASVPRNKTLVVSVSDTANQMSDVDVVNPFVTGTNRTGWQWAYEPLFFYNPWWTSKVSAPHWIKGASQGVVPYQATGYTYNSDYSAVTIKLRNGITWSDGQPFTANDVVFTLNMLKTNAPKLTWSQNVALYMKDATATDSHTVHLTLAGPNPRFMLDLLMWHQDIGFPIVPQHIWQGQNPLTFTNFDLSKGWPVVTGPWTLTQSNPQQKIWTRRGDWWGAKTGFAQLPRVEQVTTLPLFEDSKLVELFINDEIDNSHNLTPQDAQVAVAKNKKLELYSKTSGNQGWEDFWTQQIVFNCMVPPYNDPDIRWAINYAIDRKQIVEFAFSGAVPEALLPYPTYQPMHKYFTAVSDLLKKYPIATHSLKKTNQIMQSKGYQKDSSGFWSKDGTQFPMTIIIIPGFSYEESMIPVIVKQLRTAGFNASYKAPTNNGTLETTGDAQIWLQGDYGNADADPYDEISTFHSRYSAPIGQSATYPYRWSNSEFDQLIEQMSPLPANSGEYMKLYHDAMAVWLKELPAIPLSQNTLLAPANTKYWTGWPNQANPYCDAAMWHRGAAGLILNTLEPASKAS